MADVVSRRNDTNSLHLWWLGQSGFLIQWQGKYLLLDPYLSDSLTKKYAATDKPHVRMTERVIAPQRLDFIDVVTSSHNHTDHLDGETLIPLLQKNPTCAVLVPEANRDFAAERLKISPNQLTGIDAGESREIDGFKFHAVPAAHPQLERDERGLHKFLGYIIECGSWKIYHSGDTIHFDRLENWLKKFSLDVALLPINGDRPERRVPGNLDGSEAARLAKDIGARLVIPCHYDMFEFNTATPDEFVATCERLGQNYRILRQGERWSSAEKSA